MVQDGDFNQAALKFTLRLYVCSHTQIHNYQIREPWKLGAEYKLSQVLHHLATHGQALVANVRQR